LINQHQHDRILWNARSWAEASLQKSYPDHESDVD
jgi:hypothetical protein